MRNKFKNVIFSSVISAVFLFSGQAFAQDSKAQPLAVSNSALPAVIEYPKLNFLKIEGVETSSTQKGLEDYMSISSWSTGVSVYDKNPTVQDFYITIPKSNSSIILFRNLVTSKVIPSVTLVVIDPSTANVSNAKILFKFVMRNVTISNFQMSGYDSSATNMVDQLSLNYESGTYEGGEFDKNKKPLANNSVNFVVPRKIQNMQP